MVVEGLMLVNPRLSVTIKLNVNMLVVVVVEPAVDNRGATNVGLGLFPLLTNITGIPEVWTHL